MHLLNTCIMNCNSQLNKYGCTNGKKVPPTYKSTKWRLKCNKSWRGLIKWVEYKVEQLYIYIYIYIYQLSPQYNTYKTIIFNYCNLCYWPKCEHIENSSNFSFQTQFLQFIWISNNKIHSKINIVHTWALKIMNKLHYILFTKGFPTTPRMFLNSNIIFNFQLYLISIEKMVHKSIASTL
jgi:hypothetical protein